MTPISESYRTVFSQQGDSPRRVLADRADQSGASHDYKIEVYDKETVVYLESSIKFQKGPIKEVGINGIQNEDLVQVVIHRLRGFQSGPFSCRENALALTKLEESLHWMEHRTKDREGRGVEGRNKE